MKKSSKSGSSKMRVGEDSNNKYIINNKTRIGVEGQHSSEKSRRNQKENDGFWIPYANRILSFIQTFYNSLAVVLLLLLFVLVDCFCLFQRMCNDIPVLSTKEKSVLSLEASSSLSSGMQLPLGHKNTDLPKTSLACKAQHPLYHIIWKSWCRLWFLSIGQGKC